MSEPEFVSLTIRNNWEHLSYKHGDKNIKIPEKAKEIVVKWPDGTVTTENLVSERYSARVSDHGHEYDVNGKIHAIEFEHNGAKMQMRLNALKGVVLPTGTESM